MSSSASRKRPAPGASPVVPPQRQGLAPQQQAYVPQEQPSYDWMNSVSDQNNNSNAYNGYQLQQEQLQPVRQQHHPAVHGYQTQADLSPQSQLPIQHQAQPFPNISNMVARRNDNSLALVSSRAGYNTQPNPDYNALVPATQAYDPEQQQLMEAVAKAEKIAEEAQSDRAGATKKSIPPFVQKLATFLNQHPDQDLIRWSDKGDSFIVLDEDEFARTLIPQLFKHSNYASFVRQLNMYGFHKRVGLADNSMRSSEKKNKAPSEYTHPYFRRGYDVLQWLINKKKKTEADKRKSTGGNDPDSDEDFDEQHAYPISATVPRSEFDKLLRHVHLVEQKNNQALAMVRQLNASQTQSRITQERQGRNLQQIIQFLASVFRKTLEGRSADHLQEMLADMMPMQGQGGGVPNGSVIPTGSVQDLGDMSGEGDFSQQQNVAQRTVRSPVLVHRQHLLTGIPANANTQSRSGTPARASGYQSPSVTQAPVQDAGRITELGDTSPEDTTSPNMTESNSFPEYSDQTSAASPDATLMNLVNAAANDLPGSYQRSLKPQQSTQQRTQQTSPLQNMTVTSPTVVAQPSFGQGRQSNMVTQEAPDNKVQSALFENTVTPVSDFPGLEALMTEAQNQEIQEGINDPARYAAQPTPNGSIPGFDAVPEFDHDLFFNKEMAEFANSNASCDQWLNNDDSLYTAAADPDHFDYNFDQLDSNFSINDNEFPPFEAATDLADLADGIYDFGAQPADAADNPSPAVTEEIERVDFNDMEMPAAKRHRAI